jgi:hypothetical protein
MFGPCLNYLSVLIGRLDSADHVHFMEMVNSAGGTIRDLACLARKYMDNLVDSKAEAPLTAMHTESRAFHSGRPV